jgi:D-glycero-alpha-D-manno-heptose-7-phosphate kinase
VHRVVLSADRLEELDRSLMLYFTGLTRRSQEIEREKIARLPQNRGRLLSLLGQVERGHALLTGGGPLSAFGALPDEAWQVKRSLSPGVSNPQIDRMYERARAAGALGGKLLGAGGGGFLLLFVPPDRQPALREELADLGEVTFHLNATGSQFIHL